MQELREKLQQLGHKLQEIWQTILAHPQMELTYNRWLQLPKETRRNIVFSARLSAFIMFMLFLFWGSVKLLQNHLALNRGHQLTEDIATFTIDMKRLDTEGQRYQELGGIYKGRIDEVLSPIYPKVYLQPTSVKLTTLPEQKKDGITTRSAKIEVDRITVPQMTQLMLEVENTGANLTLSDLNLEAIAQERGWYKGSLKVSQLVPTEEGTK